MRPSILFALVALAIGLVEAFDERDLLRLRALSALCPDGRTLSITSCNTRFDNTCVVTNKQTLIGCPNQAYCACPDVTLDDGTCGSLSDCPEALTHASVPRLKLYGEDVRLVERLYLMSDERRAEFGFGPRPARHHPIFIASRGEL